MQPARGIEDLGVGPDGGIWGVLAAEWLEIGLQGMGFKGGKG